MTNSREKILLVDQNGTFRETLHDILAEEGYTIRVAEDSEDAAALIDTDRPDLLVVDQDAVSAKAGLIAERVTRERCPVIVLNGSSETSLFSDCTSVVLTKPFRRREILEAVHRALGAEGVPHP